MWPDPSVRYRRAEHLQVRTRPEGHEHIWDGARWIEIPRALELLSHFDEARGPGDVFDRVAAGCRSNNEGMAVLRSLALLVEAGALVTTEAVSDFAPRRWVLDHERAYHAGMLADPVRVDILVAAVRALVQQDDVVIDAGTGTGVLAVAAARAGARKVYAIETGSIAEIAARVFADNGVADRVQLIRGDARTIVLPERADVLITETIGANPFDEGILELVAALRPHLRSGARLLPARLALRAAPLAMPDNILRAWMPHDDDLRQWRARHNMDLSALTVPAAPRAVPIPVDQARAWTVAEPATVLDVVLSDSWAALVEGSCEVRVTRSGSINALALGFDADLGGGHRLDSWTRSARAASWDVSAVRLSTPVAVVRGSSIAIRVRQPASGDTPTVSVQSIT